MFEEIAATPRDRCLAELPPGGGTIRSLVCPVTPGSFDSLDTFFEPAPGPNGQLLYLREASPPDGITPISSALVLADGTNPREGTAVRTYPYPAPSGKIHQGISNIRWLSDTRVVYLAQKVDYIAPCSGCPIDTLRTGIEVVNLDLSGPAPTLTILPNTDQASSLSAGRAGDEIVFTRNGDGRVYEMNLGTGATSIIHDFGSGTIARDVQVRGNDLYAVVGGRVSFVDDPILGAIQQDFGGQLVRVDLGSGTATPMVVSERFFRRPAPAPSGSRVVAEAFSAIITACGPTCRDTTISATADLWLFDIP
jgi:hypothetical protein